MVAVLLTVALFLYWMAVGYAVLALLPARVGPRRELMLAPAIGASLVTLAIFWPNQLGFAVRSYATPTLVAVGIAAAAVLWWKRPLFPARRMKAFFAVLLAALLLAGWPMAIFGFDWAGYNNSDMTHYALGSMRVLNGGFFDPPSLDAVVQGTDHSAYDAYKYILFNARSGAERMLAALWTATGLNAQLVFMPLVMALHLMLVSAAAAMVANVPRARWAPLLVAALMAISPLTTLGAMYQLIAQVAGLGFLCASVALLFHSPPNVSTRALLGRHAALVLVMAGLFVWYPELLPFLGLGWLAYIAMLAWRDRGGAKRAIVSALVAGVMLVVILNAYSWDAVRFMLSQAQSQGGLSAAQNAIAADLAESWFPYFLLPSGLANLWGLMPIGGDWLGSSRGQKVSAVLIFSAVLTAWLLLGFARSVRRASAATAVFVVMAALGVVLFLGKRDFGLFKLAMYMQPFLIVMIAERLLDGGSRYRGATIGIATIAVFLALASQGTYVLLSTGEILAGLSEVWHSSALRITSRFEEGVQDLRRVSPAGMLSDTSSIVHLQHQALHTRGYSAYYPAMGGWFRNESAMYPAIAGRLPEDRDITLGGTPMTFSLIPHLRDELASRAIVTIPRFDTIFNKAHAGDDSQGYYRIYPPGAARNHLVFMPSSKGAYYYGYTAGVPITVNHLENDPMFPGQQFSGLGRHLLFMLVNPSPRPRLVIELSATVMKHFDSELPDASVAGESSVRAGFVGRGSGRVVTQPLTPAILEGVPFIALDMRRDAKHTPITKYGLMNLYNREINPDPRRLSVYGRDISLITEEEYHALVPPPELRSFPADLANRGLEYSGIYEDGFISEQSFCVLKGTSRDARIRITGMVPGITDMQFRTRIHVVVDGVPVIEREIGVGDFSVEAPLPGDATQKRRVEIRFDKSQVLPGDDARRTGAKISAIALVAQQD